MIYGSSVSRIWSISLSPWIFRLIGFERSREKMPMIDFASMTYLPEMRSSADALI